MAVVNLTSPVSQSGTAKNVTEPADVVVMFAAVLARSKQQTTAMQRASDMVDSFFFQIDWTTVVAVIGLLTSLIGVIFYARDR